MLFLSLAVYAGLLIFPLAEAILYPGITANKIGLQPYMLAIIGFIFSIGVRFFIPQDIWSKYARISLFVVAPLITLVCLALRYVEVHTHPNYIYSSIHLDLTGTEQLALFIAFISLPFMQKNYFKKYLAFTVIAVSIYLLHLIILTWSYPDAYIAMKKEDGFAEYATFFAYLLAGLITLSNTWSIPKLKITSNQKKLLIGFSICMSLGLFLIAAEEISWGQRIAKIEISEEMQKANTQSELNLHNNRLVFGLVYKAYFLLNLYGLLSWIAFKMLKNKIPEFWKIILRLTTSRWYLMLLFIPNLIYVILQPYYISSLDLQWEEVTEVYLAIGILIWMMLNANYLKEKSHQAAKGKQKK